jgi:large subunit ribosomal protein L25
MGEEFSLTATKREMSKHSARETRNAKRVPGVIYGKKTESTPISVDASELLKTYRKTGTSALISLDVDGKKMKVLVQNLDLHPVRMTIRHVDFLAVDLKERTDVEVPLEFIGESPAVKNFGGIFMAKYNSVVVRGLPADVPQNITIDISTLENLHDNITADELSIPADMELMGIDPQIVICGITGHKAEKEAVEEEEETIEEEGEEGEKAEEEGAK